ncbi:hypothetical protein [Bacillus cereus group sp. BfR-BA-01423]|uniref:hypothetical protein n=1 Tax=Bacillus cereus group sp. BfR-BA-01423 TaxID=2920340 RepID=UPI001F5AB1BC|nr:hypothetical protein [Bacillus cereus group sp. BfR-BA-01423]HEF5705400.1 hypothetical protein [Bacillus paranthracis]
MNIKPIETIYKGYRFRSRLEARWAVFFDALGIEWKYENEGYDLGEYGWYLPDFEIRGNFHGFGIEKWFVEIKGDMSDRIGIAKAQNLDDYPPEGFLGCLIFGELELMDVSEPNYVSSMVRAMLLGLYQKNYNQAIIKARQARFEHGETPLCKF